MGVKDVILNLPTILKNIKLTKQKLIEFSPDSVILIDFPGFNLRIAKFAKEQKFTVFYYISPQIWAWKKSRIKQIKANIDKMFVILPFEKQFYKNLDYNVQFVGHPLLEELAKKKYLKKEEFKKKHGLSDKKIIALLPGSRPQEIKKILKKMFSVKKQFTDYQFIIAGLKIIPQEFYKNIADTKIIYDDTYNLLQHSHSALVTSGTATLETAMHRVPQVVCYETNFLTYLLARLVIKIKFISIVNIIMDRKIVTELIQSEFNKKNIIEELKKINDGQGRKLILAEYSSLIEKLQQKAKASDITARSIVFKKIESILKLS